MWDAGLLAELFSNIGGNALSHATRGTQVSIKRWQDGDWAIVEISNHGEPIPSGLMPHLFDPFRRGRQTKEASSHHVPSGNLGLGLHIAHQVATAHGGGISAGCEGGITTFSVRLPWSQIEKGSARDASFNTSWGR